MKNIIFFISLIWTGLILALTLFFYNTNYNWFPTDYSNITFLLSVFNFLFSWLVIFWIYSWYIDRKEKQKDDFIAKIDNLSEKALKLTSYEVWKKLKEIWFSVSVISDFEGMDLKEFENKLIFKPVNGKNIDFKSMYYELGSLDIYLYDFSNFINYIYAKEKLILSEIDLQIYLKSKLIYFSNIDFYYTLFLLHYCACYNIESNMSTDLKTKELTINNVNSHWKIKKFKESWDKVLELLKKIN